MPTKFLLTEDELPRQWYNLAADLPTPMHPPLGPDGNPVSPEMLAPVFPMNLIEQEVSSERWIVAPETSHAVAATIQEARRATEEGREKVIVFNLSGHGLMDLAGYDMYFANQLSNHVLPEEDLEQSTSIFRDHPQAPARSTGRWS